MDKKNQKQKFLRITHVLLIWLILFGCFTAMAGFGGLYTFSQWLKPDQLTHGLQKHVDSVVEGMPPYILDQDQKSAAQSYINAVHGESTKKAFFLYRLEEGQLKSQAATESLDGYIPSPILANHVSDLNSWVEIRKIVMINGEEAGLVIGTMLKQKTDFGFILSLFLAAFLIAIVVSRIITVMVNTSVSADAMPLIAETNLITNKKKFDKRLAPKRFGPFATLAATINTLFKKIDSLIKDNQELDIANDKLAQEMENKINERTNALRIAMEEAEQANESKSTFLATMSHEIRTPMNGIIGSIDLLRKSTLNQNQFRLSDTIRESAFSLLRIIDDILDFSKIEAGKLEVESIPMSINAIVEAVGRTLLSVAEQKNIDLRLYCDPAISENLMGDPIRIRQILFNLAGNAIKFTNTSKSKKGVVQIRAEISESNLEFTNVVLRVIDNGKGMTERQVNYVFQPFSQAEGSVTRQFGGTGLGLTICQRLTDLMYGHIDVKSELGEGSEFTVSLPLRSSPNAKLDKKYDFSELDLVCFSNDYHHINAMEAYTKHYAANVDVAHSLDGLKHVAESYQCDPAHQSIWVIDATSNHDETLKVIYDLLEQPNLQASRFLVLSNTIENQVQEHDRIWYMHSMPLCRSGLLELIQDVADNKQHSPEEAVESSHTAVKAMTIEEARSNNQLVLLAEDNAMNQQVISEQLNMLGYAVEVANDGQEAIDMWRNNNYPLVLTDLHMPNKSGYDVIKAIREEGPSRSEDADFTRVVAITANALKGEEQKCISLGMDGYLTKPLELSDLEVVMKKWLPLEEDEHTKLVQEATRTKPVEAINVSNEPIQKSVLVSYLGNDPARHLKYLEMFKDRGNDLIDKIGASIEASERENIKNLAHQFKSMSKSVGAMPLFDSSLELENNAGSFSQEEIEKLYTQILKQFNQVISFIKEEYQSPEEVVPSINLDS